MKRIILILTLVIFSVALANPIAPNFFSELLFTPGGWLLELTNLEYVFSRPESHIVRPIILQSGTDTVIATKFTFSIDSSFFIISSGDIDSSFTLNPDGADLMVGFIVNNE